MHAVIRLRLGAIALGLAVVACSDSSTEPVSPPADLATALSEASLSTLDASLPVQLGLQIDLPSRAVGSPASCAFSGSTQSFACPTITVGGLTIARSFQLLAASGATQAAFDQATTDAVRTMTGMTGTFTSAGESSAIAESDTVTLSGLLSGHHVLNGRELLHITTPGQFASDLTATTIISDLRLPPRAGPGSYPLGGTITVTLVEAATGSFPAFSDTTTLTFNGTSKVDMTLSSGGHCTIDLAATGPGAISCNFP